MAAWVVYCTFDWDSRKADYRSFVEKYRERRPTKGRRDAANLWAYWTAVRNVGGLVPPDVRSAIIAAIIKLILRG